MTIVAKDGGALQKADKIDNYYGFDGGISARKLLEDGENQARTLGVQFVTDEVVGVEFAESGFAVKTLSKDLEANAVVLAAALRATCRPSKTLKNSRAAA